MASVRRLGCRHLPAALATRGTAWASPSMAQPMVVVDDPAAGVRL